MIMIDPEDVKREKAELLSQRNESNFAITSVALSLIDIAGNINWMRQTLNLIQDALELMNEDKEN